MKTIIRYGTMVAACAVALMVALPSCAQSPSGYTIFGHHVGQRRGIDRVVLITPDTRSVNVVAGETVEFIERRTGGSFVFDFPNERRRYDLRALAPAGMFGAQDVAVNVFAANPKDPNILGSLGDSNIYNRVITITPATKWINVAYPELVKIVDAQTGQSFVWNFDGRWDWGRMDLAKVAPPGMLSREQLIVYVQDQPARDGSGVRRH